MTDSSKLLIEQLGVTHLSPLAGLPLKSDGGDGGNPRDALLSAFLSSFGYDDTIAMQRFKLTDANFIKMRDQAMYYSGTLAIGLGGAVQLPVTVIHMRFEPKKSADDPPSETTGDAGAGGGNDDVPQSTRVTSDGVAALIKAPDIIFIRPDVASGGGGGGGGDADSGSGASANKPPRLSPANTFIPTPFDKLSGKLDLEALGIGRVCIIARPVAYAAQEEDGVGEGGDSAATNENKPPPPTAPSSSSFVYASGDANNKQLFRITACLDFDVYKVFGPLIGAAPSSPPPSDGGRDAATPASPSPSLVRIGATFAAARTIVEGFVEGYPVYHARVTRRDGEGWKLAGDLITLDYIDLFFGKSPITRQFTYGFSVEGKLYLGLGENGGPSVALIRGTMQSSGAYALGAALRDVKLGPVVINSVAVTVSVGAAPPSQEQGDGGNADDGAPTKKERSVVAGLSFDIHLSEVVISFDGKWCRRDGVAFEATMNRFGIKEIKELCQYIFGGGDDSKKKKGIADDDSSSAIYFPEQLEDPDIALKKIKIIHSADEFVVQCAISPWQNENSSYSRFAINQDAISFGMSTKLSDMSTDMIPNFITDFVDFEQSGFATFSWKYVRQKQQQSDAPRNTLTILVSDLFFKKLFKTSIQSAILNPFGATRFVYFKLSSVELSLSGIMPELAFFDTTFENIVFSYSSNDRDVMTVELPPEGLNGSTSLLDLKPGMFVAADCKPSILTAIFGNAFAIHVEVNKYISPSSSDPTASSSDASTYHFSPSLSGVQLSKSLEYGDGTQSKFDLRLVRQTDIEVFYSRSFAIRGSPFSLEFAVGTHGFTGVDLSAKAMMLVPIGPHTNLTEIAAVLTIGEATAIQLAATATYAFRDVSNGADTVAKFTAALKIGTAATPSFWIRVTEAKLSSLINIFLDILHLDPISFGSLDEALTIHEFVAAYAPTGMDLTFPLAASSHSIGIGGGVVLFAELQFYDNVFIGMFELQGTGTLVCHVEGKSPWVLFGCAVSRETDRKLGPLMHLAVDTKNPSDASFKLNCHINIIEGYLEGGIDLDISKDRVHGRLEAILFGLTIVVELSLTKSRMAVKLILDTVKNNIRSRAARKIKEEAKRASDEVAALRDKVKAGAEEAKANYNAAIAALQKAQAALGDGMESVTAIDKAQTIINTDLDVIQIDVTQQMRNYQTILETHQGYDQLYGIIQTVTADLQKQRDVAATQVKASQSAQTEATQRFQQASSDLAAANKGLGDAQKSVDQCKSDVTQANNVIRGAQSKLDGTPCPVSEKFRVDNDSGRKGHIDWNAYNKAKIPHDKAQQSLNEAKDRGNKAQGALNAAQSVLNAKQQLVKQCGDASSKAQADLKRLEPILASEEAVVQQLDAKLDEIRPAANSTDIPQLTAKLSFLRSYHDSMVNRSTVVQQVLPKLDQIHAEQRAALVGQIGRLEAQKQSIGDGDGGIVADWDLLTAPMKESDGNDGATDDEAVKELAERRAGLVALRDAESTKALLGLRQAITASAPSSSSSSSGGGAGSGTTSTPITDVADQVEAILANVYGAFRTCQLFVSDLETAYPQVIAAVKATQRSPLKAPRTALFADKEEGAGISANAAEKLKKAVLLARSAAPPLRGASALPLSEEEEVPPPPAPAPTVAATLADAEDAPLPQQLQAAAVEPPLFKQRQGFSCNASPLHCLSQCTVANGVVRFTENEAHKRYTYCDMYRGDGGDDNGNTPSSSDSGSSGAINVLLNLDVRERPRNDPNNAIILYDEENEEEQLLHGGAIQPNPKMMMGRAKRMIRNAAADGAQSQPPQLFSGEGGVALPNRLNHLKSSKPVRPGVFGEFVPSQCPHNKAQCCEQLFNRNRKRKVGEEAQSNNNAAPTLLTSNGALLQRRPRSTKRLVRLGGVGGSAHSPTILFAETSPGAAGSAVTSNANNDSASSDSIPSRDYSKLHDVHFPPTALPSSEKTLSLRLSLLEKGFALPQYNGTLAYESSTAWNTPENHTGIVEAYGRIADFMFCVSESHDDLTTLSTSLKYLRSADDLSLPAIRKALDALDRLCAGLVGLDDGTAPSPNPQQQQKHERPMASDLSSVMRFRSEAPAAWRRLLKAACAVSSAVDACLAGAPSGDPPRCLIGRSLNALAAVTNFSSIGAASDSYLFARYALFQQDLTAFASRFVPIFKTLRGTAMDAMKTMTWQIGEVISANGGALDDTIEFVASAKLNDISTRSIGILLGRLQASGGFGVFLPNLQREIDVANGHLQSIDAAKNNAKTAATRIQEAAKKSIDVLGREADGREVALLCILGHEAFREKIAEWQASEKKIVAISGEALNIILDIKANAGALAEKSKSDSTTNSAEAIAKNRLAAGGDSLTCDPFVQAMRTTAEEMEKASVAMERYSKALGEMIDAQTDFENEKIRRESPLFIELDNFTISAEVGLDHVGFYFDVHGKITIYINIGFFNIHIVISIPLNFHIQFGEIEGSVDDKLGNGAKESCKQIKDKSASQ